MENLFCPWPSATYFIYSPDVPQLLYYAYIPIIIFSLAFCFFVAIKDRFSLMSKLFIGISTLFSLWILNILVQWASNEVVIQMFAWQMTAAFEVPIFLLSIYFVLVFLNNKDISPWQKILLFILMLPVFTLLPTKFNVESFYLTADDCGGNIGLLWKYIYYFLEPFSVAFIAIITFYKSFFQKNQSIKLQTFLLGLGMVIFLGLFYITNLAGELTQFYEINLVGPLGMVAFLSLLSYMIVKFRLFNARVLGAQALIIALGAMIFALLFIEQIEYVRIVISITLILVLLLGIALIKGVKREVQQRIKIETLARDLEEANGRQESLIHFISHEVKGYLTKNQAIFAGIKEGDYGQSTPELNQIVDLGFKETKKGVDTVIDILSASNLKKGTVAYNMKQFDFKAALVESVEDFRNTAAEKALRLETDFSNDDFTYTGDKDQITKHVLRNLIDNSIKYTLKGGLLIGLKKENKKILFSVKDTGIGITPEDKKRLFTEGGRGRESTKVNVNSTGYGLFIAKQIVEAHKGRIWVESEGSGKGSTFFVEL
jgi:signal transduction histidine kinase